MDRSHLAALAHQGMYIAPDVASEGRAGYGVRGDHGSVFANLTARAVRPDDALVVFFGPAMTKASIPAVLADMAARPLIWRAAPRRRRGCW